MKKRRPSIGASMCISSMGSLLGPEPIGPEGSLRFCEPPARRHPQGCPFSTDALELNAEERAILIASTKSPISFLSKLGQTISRKRSPKVRGRVFSPAGKQMARSRD